MDRRTPPGPSPAEMAMLDPEPGNRPQQILYVYHMEHNPSPSDRVYMIGGFRSIEPTISGLNMGEAFVVRQALQEHAGAVHSYP